MRLLHVWALGCAVVLLTGCGQEERVGEGVVGTWAGPGGPNSLTMEFAEDGEIELLGNVEPLESAFEFAQTMSDRDVRPDLVTLTYRSLEEGKLAIKADFSKFVVEVGDESMNATVSQVAEVTVGQKEMTIADEDGGLLRFTRVR